MRKVVSLLICILMSVTCFACAKTSEDALRFKESYESLNGLKNKNNKEYRVVNIDKENPFVYATMEDIMERINNKESFVVYFGANWCPWCRSILPTFIEVMKENKIKTVYYVDVRPDNDEDKEIRNVYAINENGEIYLKHEGSVAYQQFIKVAQEVLPDYSSGEVESLDGTEWSGEKRVGAPNFVVVKDGVPTYMTTAISSLQDDPYMELNDDIVNDVRNQITKMIAEFK